MSDSSSESSPAADTGPDPLNHSNLASGAHDNIMGSYISDFSMADPVQTPSTESTPSHSRSHSRSRSRSRSPNPTSASPSGPALASGPPPNTRRCFVCLGDEPKDALPVDWSTPCQCSLEGHQECLLAWVADLDAQAKPIICPACKSSIVVTERYDAAIQLSNYLNNRFSRWSPRFLLALIGSGAWVSSSVYGAKAISWFAGPEAISAFLPPKIGHMPLFPPFQPLQRNHAVNILRFSMLPLIAPALVMNRMNVADMVTLPASLVYATLFNSSTEVLAWPPSPSRVMALYPALKSTYFHIHRAVSTTLEKTWAARARTMGIEHGSHATHDFHEPPEPAPAMNILDLEIDIQIGEAEEDWGGHGGNAQRNRAADTSSRSPINFIAGALLFPGVCYGVGELMRQLLPPRLVNKPMWGPPTGLLQERWGRSFVGGCLFVVLKDVFFLYVKYKKMMNRPYRKIKNSDRRHIRD